MKIYKLFLIIIYILLFILLFCNKKQPFTIGSQVLNSNEGGVGVQEHLANTIHNNSEFYGEDYEIVKHDTLYNIYGDSLERCKTGTENGSWDPDGYCSEEGGGVHQICFDVTPARGNFSLVTGQTDWSTGRVGNNHCMCLGAWALYKAQDEGDGNELVCDAIPEMALEPRYIDNWNTWNCDELDHQIIKGVDSLVKQCYDNETNIDKKQNLKNKYDYLRNKYTDFVWNSIFD
tara:strand:- start:2029 stop:2724 length:696 start_codon:yes stop_codon:yes gene_type:complete